MRFFITPSHAVKNVSIACVDGTLPGTAKFIVRGSDGAGNIVKEKYYDNLVSISDLHGRINDSPNYLNPLDLLNVEILTSTPNLAITQRLEKTILMEYGFSVVIYQLGVYEAFSDLRDAAKVVEAINYGSQLVNAELIAGYEAIGLKTGLVGLKMFGANPGDNVATVDYLQGLIEAELYGDVTVVIAPGVDDVVFHAMMKDHCVACSQLGKYRICVVGGKVGESDDEKIARGNELSHQRVCCIGDGLYLNDPRTLERKLFPPSVVVAPFVGQLLSNKYYVCQTHKYIKNAYGVEHNYDDGALAAIRQAGGRLVMFRFDSGVQIVDAITTSTYNAYEDIHMVRLYDVISRNIRNKMMNSVVGRSNLPMNWAYATGLMRNILDFCKKCGAIEDFTLLSDVSPQDMVDRRYRFKIGLIPTFPVKYVEAMIDILPPFVVES
jgi:hypothetical protein